MSRMNCKVKDVSKYQSLADLLYIQSNNYQSMSGQEYLADAVDELIAIKSDAYALAMSDDYIEAMDDLAEYEATLLQNDGDCPDYSESNLIPFIVSPVIVPTCFLGSLRSAFSSLLIKFNLTFKCNETKTVFRGGNQAAQREKVPIMQCNNLRLINSFKKSGFIVEAVNDRKSVQYRVISGNKTVAWHVQNDKAICVRCFKLNDQPDIVTDYFTGHSATTIKGAVAYLQN